jgi:type II secretory pathway pseudopilin PulG
MRNCRSKTIRNNNALTLVELLVVSLVMGFLSAAAFGIIVSTMGQGRTLEQKCDGINAARNALDKIGRQVRMGRNIGDCFGDINPLSGVVTGTPNFPGSNDAIYGNGAADPPGGWPVWADSSAPSSFTMAPYPGDGTCNGNNCLICQVPVFDANGFPLGIPPGYKSPGSSVVANPTTTGTVVQTYIYRVLPDPANPGEFLLQVAVIPGYGQPAAGPPRTLAKAIVGPINPATGQPRIFQYIDRVNPTNPPVDGIPAGGTPPAANYSGVIVNLEINSHQSSVNQADSKPLALKSEVYLRNNSMATSQGLPSGSNGY